MANQPPVAGEHVVYRCVNSVGDGALADRSEGLHQEDGGVSDGISVRFRLRTSSGSASRCALRDVPEVDGGRHEDRPVEQCSEQDADRRQYRRGPPRSEPGLPRRSDLMLPVPPFSGPRLTRACRAGASQRRCMLPVTGQEQHQDCRDDTEDREPYGKLVKNGTDPLRAACGLTLASGGSAPPTAPCPRLLLPPPPSLPPRSAQPVDVIGEPSAIEPCQPVPVPSAAASPCRSVPPRGNTGRDGPETHRADASLACTTCT